MVKTVLNTCSFLFCVLLYLLGRGNGPSLNVVSIFLISKSLSPFKNLFQGS